MNPWWAGRESFEEFVNFKTGYKYRDRLSDFFAIEKTKTCELLEEYLNFGGYPRIVLGEKQSEKIELINEIYQSYIERDISYLLKVHKTESFSNLVKVIASQIGRLVNFSELSSTLGISLKTLKDYLWYLEKTFILLGIFGNLRDISFAFENFVFLLLKEKTRRSPLKIQFWRTKDGGEVDFVIDTDRYPIPIEVKYKRLSKPEITRSLRSFIQRYKPEKALVVNLTLEASISLNYTRIEIVPFHKPLKEPIL